MLSRTSVAFGLVASSLFAIQAQATVLLDVDFESGYTLGDLNGQTGGTVGGNWNAPWTTGSTQKVVVSSPALGSKAASASRDNGGDSYTSVDLAAPQLDTSLSSIYYSFDFYRGDDNDHGLITLYNKNSGNNTGLGVSIPTGASPTLDLITAGGFATSATTYQLENSKWYRVEFEANGATDQYNAYIQKQGVSGRTQIGTNVAWSAPNGIVTSFLYYAQGLTESNIVVDNLYLETGATFPVDRPLAVPEPAALSLLGLAALFPLRRRSKR